MVMLEVLAKNYYERNGMEEKMVSLLERPVPFRSASFFH
jgi:hypothetical protein